MGRETQKLPTQQGENGGYKYPILRCIYLLIAGKSFPLTKLNRKPEGKGRLVWFTEVSLPGTYQDEKDREWNWSCNSFPLSVTHLPLCHTPSSKDAFEARLYHTVP